MTERIQRVLARAGIASRRAAERLVEEGRVSVNGSIVTVQGSRVDPERDAIRVDGRRIRPAAEHRTYLMLHKPPGCVTTLADPERRPTVAHLISSVGARVYPVGRLDFNSEGLLLLTDDGDLAHRLTHPGQGVEKTYHAKVRGQPDRTALAKLARGIAIDGRPTLPARVRLVRRAANCWLEVTVVEGRKHLVRRMLQAIGHPVVRLRRVRFAGLELGRLPRGRFRELTPTEIGRLRACVARPS